MTICVCWGHMEPPFLGMPSRHTNNFPESGRGLGRVTPTNFGSTVGYSSDSLASCFNRIPSHGRFCLRPVINVGHINAFKVKSIFTECVFLFPFILLVVLCKIFCKICDELWYWLFSIVYIKIIIPYVCLPVNAKSIVNQSCIQLRKCFLQYGTHWHITRYEAIFSVANQLPAS